MSEYVSYSYDYEPAVAVGAVATAAGIADTGGIVAAAAGEIIAGIGLAAVAGATTVAGLSRRFEARMQAFAAAGHEPLDARIAALTEQPLLHAAVALEAPGGVAGLGACDARTFDRLLQQGESRLRAAESQVLRSQIAAAMQEVGYTIAPARQPAQANGLLRGAASDGTSIVARTSPARGVVEFDFAGFSGRRCEQARARLHAALRRRGVRLQALAGHRHGSPEGGALARAARAEERAGVRRATVDRSRSR